MSKLRDNFPHVGNSRPSAELSQEFCMGCVLSYWYGSSWPSYTRQSWPFSILCSPQSFDGRPEAGAVRVLVGRELPSTLVITSWAIGGEYDLSTLWKIWRLRRVAYPAEHWTGQHHILYSNHTFSLRSLFFSSPLDCSNLISFSFGGFSF